MSHLNSGNGTEVKLTQPQAFSGGKNLEIPYAEGLGSVGRSAVATFVEYVQKMDPKVINTEEVAMRYQAGLYNAIIMTINRNGVDFNKTWAALLKIVDENRQGVFHDRLVYRYMHNSPLTSEKRRAYMRLIHFIRDTAPIKGRANVLKHIDIERTLSFDITEEGRQRVMNFYSKFMT